ncbi:MAG: hypothetical protein E5Y59_26670, partial [Mesorhizobium sp.]
MNVMSMVLVLSQVDVCRRQLDVCRRPVDVCRRLCEMAPNCGDLPMSQDEGTARWTVKAELCAVGRDKPL